MRVYLGVLMGMRLISLVASLVISVMLAPVSVLANPEARVLIVGVKIGGIVAGEPTEYINVYNDSNVDVDLSNWRVEYAKPNAKINDCNAIDWIKQDSSSSVKSYTLNGVIASHQTVQVEVSMNDNSGGSVRLVQDNKIWDLVGWGSMPSSGVCKEEDFAPIPANTKSIQRAVDDSGYFIDTDNNYADFSHSTTDVNIDTNSPNNTDTISTNDSCRIDDCAGVGQQASNLCTDLAISEILPNPSGTDSGNEYIELYNSSSSTINLSLCSIKIGNSTKKLTGLAPPGYWVHRGLVLPNADGGMVELITSTNEDVVSYPAGLHDNEAWALIDGKWQVTSQPTPGTANILIVPTEVATATTTNTTTLESCGAGKYRNPETNRCKSVGDSQALKPCEPGQVRNPDTNRCRSTAIMLANLKPCDVGQTRNPSTNRCKKVSATTTLAVCKEGQVRNPDTNRCRKVAGSTTNASATNTPSSESNQQKNKLNYGVFAGIAVLVLGYGVYEYREDIVQKLSLLRGKILKQK